MDLSVIICTRNRSHLLLKVLETLEKQELAPEYSFEVVVIDNGSEDDTQIATRNFAEQTELTLRYFYQEHSSIASARNVGITQAKGEIILIIDDDVLADPHLLAEHIKSQQEIDNCVVNGWVNHIKEDTIPTRKKPTMKDISNSFFWTSNVSVKRKHLIEAGLFDEDFNEYGWEDQELGKRLRLIGLVRNNNYKAVGYHIKKPPTGQHIEGAIRQSAANARMALLYLSKYPHLRTRMATSTYPPRLAIAKILSFGGVLKRYCDHQLQKAKGSETPLTTHQQWCLNQRCSIEYFKHLECSDVPQ